MMYSLIRDLKPVTWDKVKAAWEGDLGIELSEEMWQDCLKRIHTSSMCIRHGLIQFKILHRLHYSGEKLARLFNIPDPGCPRCNQTPTSLGHMFWTCPSLETYWRQIFNVLSRICGTEIVPSFHTAIFGIIPPDCSATSPQSNAVAFASLLARRLILLNWKSKTAPSFPQWLKDVLSFLPLEKLRYKVRNANKNFILAWSPFIDFVGECPF